MPQVKSETIVNAPLEKVYAIAKDPERFPELMEDVESVKILEREENAQVVEWVGIVPQFHRRVHWIERDEWDDSDHTCRFIMTEGDFDKYEGTWAFERTSGSTLMKLSFNYEFNIPLIGPLIQKVVLNAVQGNADGMLAGIKAAAEHDE